MRALNALIAVVMVLSAFASCDTEPKKEIDDPPGETCSLNRTEYDFGNVRLGEARLCYMTITADNEEDPHLVDTVTVDCADFYLYDPYTNEAFDTLFYDLTAPANKHFEIRFEPSELGPATCEVDMGEECGTLSLTGNGIVGGLWYNVASPTQADLYDIWFYDAFDDGIVCGDSGIVLATYDGYDFWYTPPHGYKYEIFGDTKLKSVWIDGAENRYAAGGEIEAGAAEIFKFDMDAGEWEVLDADYMVEFYSSIWGAGDCDIFFCGTSVLSMGGANVKRYLCDEWTTYEVDMGMSNVSGVFGTSASDVWAVFSQQSNNVYHFDGSTWTLARETWMQDSLNDIWISDEGDIFIAGSGGAVYHHDGGSWSDETISGLEGVDFYSVRGNSADDVWVVGSGATIYHYDGNIWSQQAVPDGVTETLYSVWALGELDVWVVGAAGRILHFR